MSDAGWHLKEWREHAGLTMEGLAERVGTSPGQLSDLEKGKRRYNRDWLEKFATALDIGVKDLFSPPAPAGTSDPVARTVRVVGYVGAGDAAHYYDAAQGPFDEVQAPEYATKETVAAEVRGPSIGKHFDGWLVFYDERRSPVTPDMIGKLCVVGLLDGRILVKVIKAARTPGYYHLLSETEGPMNDEEIEWAAEVTGMRPR